MAAEKQFRTVIGIVQFEPKAGEAGGKAVRNIVVRQVGFKEQAIRVSATLWPSHAHVEVNEGDVVVLEGSYTQNKSTAQDGTPRTYHNMSVNKIAVLGKADSGARPDVEADGGAADADDDDVPF